MGAAILPLTLAAGVAGAGISAAGAYSSAEAQSANAAYQAQVAANNAKIALQNAEMDTQSGEVQAANSQMKTRATVGATLAGEAASGVSVNSGSFPKVRTAESELGMLDALTIRSNAAKQAYSQDVAATGDTAESGLLQSESEQASAAAIPSSLGSFLSQASTVGGSYLKFLQTA